MNGTWNGLIRKVETGAADIAAGILAVSEERLNVVDFTESFTRGEILLASRADMTTLPHLNFQVFAGFSVPLWISIICLTLVSCAFICAAEKSMHLRSNLQFGCDVIMYTMGLLFQRDIGGLVPNNIGSRVVSITLALTLMIVMTTYTAVMASRNIINVKTLRISGMNDPKVTHPTPNFKIATYKGSRQSEMFEKSHLDSWRRLGEFMRPYNFPGLPEAYENLRKGKLQAFIVDGTSLSMGWKNNKYCSTQIVDIVYTQEWAFAVQKGSRWNEVLSALIRKYRENGVIDTLERKHLGSHCAKEGSSQPQFGILYLGGACGMLVLGIILSLCFFILEHAIYLCAKKFPRNIASSDEFE